MVKLLKSANAYVASLYFFYILFFHYLLEKLERSSIPVLPSHMNSWKSEKNHDFVYVAGNVGEHGLSIYNLLDNNYLITLKKKVEETIPPFLFGF